MQQIELSELEPGAYYWAFEKGVAPEEMELEIVQISTVFGSSPEYLSIAVMGTDQHYSVENYIFFEKVAGPETVSPGFNLPKGVIG